MRRRVSFSNTLQDMPADPDSMKPPIFSKWDKPTRDPALRRFELQKLSD